MLKCIIFDVDGTLLDTEDAVKTSLQRVLKEELNRDFSSDELDFVLGIPGKASLEQLEIADIPRVSEKWNEYMLECKHLIKVFDGIEPLLKRLQTMKIATGIVTSKTQTELDHEFVPYGLMPFLDAYVCASDTERHKPFPDPILKFLERTGFAASEVVYIGDTVYDYQAAAAADVPFILARWGAKTNKGIDAFMEIDQPDDVIRELGLE